MTPCQKLLKQEGTARRIESMQQSSATPSLHLWFLGVAEDCCMLSILLAVPSCFNSFWHGVIPTSYYDFYTCNISIGWNWRYFSTFDRHHYNHGGYRCGYTDQAGWWYFHCDHTNLNGRHQPTDLPGTRPLRQRLVWKTETGYDIYTHSEMKIRPQMCLG